MNLFPRPLAFVDVETTGGSADRHRVIEIGIVRIDPDGTARRYSTLVNPGGSAPDFILELTGIDAGELAAAPSFEEVAWDAWDLMKGAVFVAHNARFDHAFLRREYERLDSELRVQMLCSVRLSRALYPEFRRHDLSSVIARMNLKMDRRHRALDDAEAVLEFFNRSANEKPDEFIKALNRLISPLPPRATAWADLSPEPSPGPDLPTIQLG